MPVDIEDCRDAMRILHETIFEPESDQTLWECFADALEEEEISADELLDFYDDVRSRANAGVRGDSMLRCSWIRPTCRSRRMTTFTTRST